MSHTQPQPELPESDRRSLNPQAGEDRDTPSWWTVPNALSLFRWLGSFALIGLGIAEREQAFVIWYVILALSDWLDGKIAVSFHLRSPLGARLDSWADATLYVCLGLGGLWLWRNALWQHWPWLVLTGTSYAAATGFGWLKFGQWPSYHTRSAKGSWLFVLAAVACLAWDWATWPVTLALIMVTLANVESILITWRLDQPQEDVIGLWKVPQLNAAEKSQS